jgi:hypothetical protein
MFWFVEYCKVHDLYLVGEKVYDKERLVGDIDFYNETVTIGKDKLLFKHFAIAMIENTKIHGDK